MARRISRRSQDEALTRKRWFNAVAALVLLVVATVALHYAHTSDSLSAYVLAAVLVGGGLNRVIRGLRSASDL